MLYAIYACENIYGGLHGMDAHDVVDCADEEEAESIGLEMSIDVMDSYECISDDLEEAASEEYEPGSEEWEDYLYQLKQENSSYVIYPIVDTKGKSEKELEELFWNDRIGFIEEYCQK